MQNAINICKAMYDETGSEYHLARLAYANCLMGDVMCKMGQVAEAEEYYNANVEYCEISYGNEKDLDSLNSLVEALHKLAFYLDKHFSRGDALEAFKALLSTCQLLYKDHMDDPDYVEELFAICEKIRDHLPQYDKALPSRLEITQKAVEYGQFLVEANGDDARMLFRLAHCYYTLCEIAQLMTNWELFTENAQKALNTWNVCADKHMEQNDKNGANAVLGVAIQISQWMAKYSENLYGPWVAHFQKRMDALA